MKDNNFIKSASASDLFGVAVRKTLSDYAQLVKLRLSLMVVFSSFLGYVIGATQFSWFTALFVILGGLFVTFSANALNQVLERDYDLLMVRTQERPLPTKSLKVPEAILFAGLSCLLGTLFLAYISMWAAFLGLISFVLYVFVYTPLKRFSSIAVLVGAIPGAFPVLIGWISGAGVFSQEGLLLFSIQFFWQLPHFWSIAWLSQKDYANAGFKMIPEKDGVPGFLTASQSFAYSIALLILPVIFYLTGHAGWLGSSLLLLVGLHFSLAAFRLFRNLNDVSARKLLFASLIYLPLALLSLCLDKWLMI